MSDRVQLHARKEGVVIGSEYPHAPVARMLVQPAHLHPADPAGTRAEEDMVQQEEDRTVKGVSPGPLRCRGPETRLLQGAIRSISASEHAVQIRAHHHVRFRRCEEPAESTGLGQPASSRGARSRLHRARFPAGVEVCADPQNSRKARHLGANRHPPLPGEREDPASKRSQRHTGQHGVSAIAWIGPVSHGRGVAKIESVGPGELDDVCPRLPSEASSVESAGALHGNRRIRPERLLGEDY